MTPDDSFEPTIARIAPHPVRRVRSAVGLVVLLLLLGVVAAVLVTILVLLSILVLNNTL